MGTNCAPLVADLFLFCYERDFMLSLSEDNQSGVIEAFISTSTYELGIFHANQTTKCLRNQGRTKGEGWSTAN